MCCLACVVGTGIWLLWIRDLTFWIGGFGLVVYDSVSAMLGGSGCQFGVFCGFVTMMFGCI